MPTKIKIIGSIIAIAGLLSETMGFFINLEIEALFNVRALLSSVHLTYFNARIFEYHNFSSGVYVNLINTFFYILLLTGTIIFSFSKEKETRLVRFVMSILFMANLISFVWRVSYTVTSWNEVVNQNLYWWLIRGAAYIQCIGLIYFSYITLRYFEHTKTLNAVRNETEGSVTYLSQTASNWHRLTHLIVDTIICIFIFSSLTQLPFLSFLNALEDVAGSQTATYLFLLIGRLLYYTLFESILGVTPAKLLTETRVVTDENQKPKPITILGRTIARYIPFEPLSFFGDQGWHDSLSRTQVVCEVRTGVKGRWYLLTIPSAIIISLVIYWGNSLYEDYQSYLYSKREHEKKIVDFQKNIQDLTTSHIIQIEDIDNPYSDDLLYLKVEEIEGNDITAIVIQRRNDYSNSLLAIEKIYNESKDRLTNIPIKRADLAKAYTPDYDEYERKNYNSAELLYDGRKFEIKRIEKLFGPSIYNRGTGMWGDLVSLDFCNYGWPAHIVEIKTLEGDITWTNDLPKPVPTVTGRDYPSFSIEGTRAKNGEKYKFQITVMDSLNHRQLYIINGNKNERTIQRIE